MTDATALLQSILSDPADDLPRLLYADHLDERGEGKRAEFVRVQVELERPIGQSFVDVEEILELRRRERDILLYNPWPQWFYLPKNQEGYFLNGFGFETQNQQGIGITPQRGFVASIRLSWADWLKHHEALYWHPKQTVECQNCEGTGEFTRENSDPPYGPCPDCGGRLWTGPYYCEDDYGWDKGTGRIPRPFVTTAQPITRVELTTWPIDDEETVAGVISDPFAFVSDEDHLFTLRENHPPKRPPNEWHCDQWPTITFAMPDSR